MGKAQSLEELKAENAAKEAIKEPVETVVDDVDPVEEDNAPVESDQKPVDEPEQEIEPELDEDGNPIKKALEPWQETDDQPTDVMPVKSHIKAKQKLKGRISEQDDEISRLKAENEALKAKKAEPSLDVPEIPKRPRLMDFDTTEEYENALDAYEDEAAAARFARIQHEKETAGSQKKVAEQLTKAVDDHFERAEKLITETGIKPEIYKAADTRIRASVESIAPKRGDLITDQIISIIGEGSEKVMYYLGNNKTALGTFKTLLVEDPTGMKAAVYIGQQKERLTNPKKPQTRAPAPAPTINGDATTSAKEQGLKRKYEAAHKKGDVQSAFTLKRNAKASGIDVSKW